MGTHGVELNGGIAYSTGNLNEFGDQLPKYNGLRTLSFSKSTINNAWIKILDENFQSDITQFSVSDRKLTRLAVTFIGTTSFYSESSSQGMFLLSLLIKKSTTSPYNVIASVEVNPINGIDTGFSAEAIVGYKDVVTSLGHETNVKCFVNLPFKNDDLQLTPIFFKSNVNSSGDTMTINPVGDTSYFNEYQRVKGLFDINGITNNPNSAVDYNNMMDKLSGYTLISTNKYIPSQSGNNLIRSSSNIGNFALKCGWYSYNSSKYNDFNINNCLSYSKPYDCFCYNNYTNTISPEASDIQLIYNITSNEIVSGIYTATIYCMSDVETNFYFSVMDKSLKDLSSTDLNPSQYNIPIDNKLNMKKFIKKINITNVSDNTFRIFLGNIPKGANFYFKVKLEQGYNSTDHSLSIKDNTMLFSTTPPSSTTWEQGRIVHNIAPTVGSYAGWICTSYGVPGTWTGFGQVGAIKGSTATRPSSVNIYPGYLYLDTTLATNGKPIWWNGGNWVDSTGAIV